MAREVAPFVVTALKQNKGRGRNGRHWESLLGQYSASFVIDMPKARADAPKLSLVTAWALLKLLQDWGLPHVNVKWPNDVLVGRRKIAGILLEAAGDHVIIGTGVNLSVPVSEDVIQGPSLAPVSLSEYRMVEFEEFHHAFSENLSHALEEFTANGFEPIREALLGHMLLRESMLVDEGKGARLVALCDIGEDGALIVEYEGEIRKVYAGDLWFEEKA